MTTYSIDAGHGTQLITGLDGYDHARSVAQRLADDRGESVFLYAAGRVDSIDEETGEAEVATEEIEPAPVAIHLAISAGTRSSYYPSDEQTANGALDYDVTLTIGDIVTEGGITLYRDRINGGMSTCGTPLDGWCGGSILAAIDGLPEARRRAVIDALSMLDDGDVA